MLVGSWSIDIAGTNYNHSQELKCVIENDVDIYVDYNPTINGSNDISCIFTVWKVGNVSNSKINICFILEDYQSLRFLNFLGTWELFLVDGSGTPRKAGFIHALALPIIQDIYPRLMNKGFLHVFGANFTSDTKCYVNNEVIGTSFVNTTALICDVPQLTGVVNISVGIAGNDIELQAYSPELIAKDLSYVWDLSRKIIILNGSGNHIF